MIELSEDGILAVKQHNRYVFIQFIDRADHELALRAMGYSPTTARIFGNGAERADVIHLAEQKHLIERN